MSCNDYEKCETGMTDYQTKILLAAIADMLDSAADINEARVRFASITGDRITSTKNSGAIRVDNTEDKPKDKGQN